MLDARLTRIFLLPVFALVILVAFSVTTRPQPLRTGQAPNAFDGDAALRTVNQLAATYPSRPAGGPADNDLANAVAESMRASDLKVRTVSSTARTPNGDSEIQTVIGRRTGSTPGAIVIVAPRDSIRAGASAELTGTATLMQLASLLADRSVVHPIVFVSTSGSIGQAGTRALVNQIGEPVRAVIVLGTLGTPQSAPPVTGFSNGPQIGSLRLRRTLEDALKTEGGGSNPQPSIAAQVARLAAPATTGPQGPLLRAGLPAVLLSTSGDHAPAAGAVPTGDGLSQDGRAVLRSVIAIDNAGAVYLGPEQRLVSGDAVIPGWAIRLIVFGLLVPPFLLVVDGIARARREHVKVGRWVLWTALLMLPLLLGLLAVRAAVALGSLNLPPGPVDPAAWTGSSGAIAIFVVVALLGFFALRPLVLLVFGLRGMSSATAGAPLGFAAVLEGVALVTWAVNPYAAAVMLPAVLIWLIALDVRLRPPTGWALLLVAIGAVPILALLGAVLTRYDLGSALDAVAWLIALLAAGGAGVFAQLWFASVGGLMLAAFAIARHGRAHEFDEDPEVTVRGPVSYAGPGSLGGVDSALKPR